MSRILRPKEVRHLLGDIGNTTLYEWIRQGKLPPPIKVVEGGRACGWPEDVITKLIENRTGVA